MRKNFILLSLASLALSVGAETSDNLTFQIGNVTFKMVKVEKGEFQMGSIGGEDDEKPVHKVTLTKDYYMGQTEVTQALYKAVMGSNPSNFTTSDQLPVETVSYNDITKETDGFLAKLNAKINELYTDQTYTFRLPTEAEWEFAARGGNKSSKVYTYSGSNEIDDVAWYDSNSNGTTHEVAKKKANELGLYDMSGNVYEWCSDWYGAYSSEDQTDPTGAGSAYIRVVRGGSWDEDEPYSRSSYRGSGIPSQADDYIGLRLCLSGVESSDINIGDIFTVAPLTYKVTKVDPAECEVNSYVGSDAPTSLVIPETVTYKGKSITVTAIGASAFEDTNLSEVTIPSTVKSIGDRAFANCSLKKLTINNYISPTLGEDAFDGVSNCALVVSEYLGGEYYNKSPWYDGIIFKLPMDTTGIDDVTADDNAVEVERYNVNGAKLSAPQKGINIIKMSNGTVKKVVVTE